jgi:hypothetical protein
MKQASFVLPPLPQATPPTKIVPSRNKNENENENKKVNEERKKPIKIAENIYRL